MERECCGYEVHPEKLSHHSWGILEIRSGCWASFLCIAVTVFFVGLGLYVFRQHGQAIVLNQHMKPWRIPRDYALFSCRTRLSRGG